MANENEIALIGWSEIAAIFRKGVSSMRKKKGDLLEAGVIFYVSTGNPPKKRVAAFPSILKKWAALKGQRGEPI